MAARKGIMARHELAKSGDRAGIARPAKRARLEDAVRRLARLEGPRADHQV